jgi:3-oxoacyl-[acyl-carrier-protein] synthase-3
MVSSFIAGTGLYLPERRLTNADLEKMVDTSDEWIVQRTGIRERRIAAEDQATSDLAAEAARQAIQAAEIDPSAIDALILCTCTPDTILPSGAVWVQRKLALGEAAAFDVSAACTGFVYGVTLASSMITSGVAKNIVVIGAETLSRIVDYQDRNTCILFGDGAGAVVLSAASGESESGIVDSVIRADGSGAELIEMPAGGARQPASPSTIEARQHFVRMDGKEVFKFATRSIVYLIETALERNNVDPNDLKLVVPHQVNHRIIEAALKKIDLPYDRFYLNLERYGNTSAASVPIGLHEAVQEGRVNRGDWVLLLAFGAGMTWGYNLLRW